MVTTRSSVTVSESSKTTISSTATAPSDARRPVKRVKATAVEAKETRVIVEETEAPPAKKQRPRQGKTVTAEPDPQAFTPRIQTAWKIGAHVSAAGGVENAIVNAAKIGANAFALFLKSQRKWEGPPLSKASKASFKRRLDAFGYSQAHILPHGNYLMNMASPDAHKREKAYRCFIDELRRCEELGLTLYNFHPGSTTGGCTVEKSLGYIADYINRAHRATSTVVTVIENMAGAGNVVGGDFAHIARIIEQVEDKTRVGVCLDTCHMFAAGYDIRTKETWTQTMKEFDSTIGLSYLRGMHLNDSKAAFDSKKDRHDNLGQGAIGLDAFAHIVQDERTRGIPLILETPSNEHEDVWRTEIATLHALVGDRDSSSTRSAGAGTSAEAIEAGVLAIKEVVKASSKPEKTKVKKVKGAGTRGSTSKRKRKRAKVDDDEEDGGDTE